MAALTPQNAADAPSAKRMDKASAEGCGLKDFIAADMGRISGVLNWANYFINFYFIKIIFQTCATFFAFIKNCFQKSIFMK